LGIQKSAIEVRIIIIIINAPITNAAAEQAFAVTPERPHLGRLGKWNASSVYAIKYETHVTDI